MKPQKTTDLVASLTLQVRRLSAQLTEREERLRKCGEEITALHDQLGRLLARQPRGPLELAHPN